MASCRYPSLYAGLPQQQLQDALTKAQAALIELNSGARGVSFSYDQGSGTKSVTYTPATREGLTSLIRDLQAELGIIPRARRPMRLIYR
ncbi:MAG: gpW family head-tail joining protein [Pseudomonadota bacterium]